MKHETAISLLADAFDKYRREYPMFDIDIINMNAMLTAFISGDIKKFRNIFEGSDTIVREVVLCAVFEWFENNSLKTPHF